MLGPLLDLSGISLESLWDLSEITLGLLWDHSFLSLFSWFPFVRAYLRSFFKIFFIKMRKRMTEVLRGGGGIKLASAEFPLVSFCTAHATAWLIFYNWDDDCLRSGQVMDWMQEEGYLHHCSLGHWRREKKLGARVCLRLTLQGDLIQLYFMISF